ncbi:MAG: glycosyl hydrolase [Candidatus Sumerlaeota bacterium]
MKAKLKKDFQNPGSEFRGAPFWAWNGKLEPEELKRQVRIMHRMGLGGFFMHSRTGLDTEYMSEEWMDCIEATIEEAKRLKMQPWLYDEDRWPSGFAGGLVTKDPKYRIRTLQAKVHDSLRGFKWTKDMVAAFTAKVEDETACDVHHVARNQKPKLPKGYSLITFTVYVAGASERFNHAAYLDTMNPEAVKKFIEVTHEAYVKRFGENISKYTPGIFTDEPNRGAGCRPGDPRGDRSTCYQVDLSWTESVPKVFKERYGYELLPHLIELVFDIEGQEISKARWDFHDCVTFMFCDAFARQIGEYCEKYNLLHTGHVLAETGLMNQGTKTGSNMRFYEHMQAPGMDLLRQVNREYNTAKWVSSAARQFDRKWRLTETYGCTGWDFPFRGHKALGDWQAALGINLRCQHLSWYTMQGQAKRDYPASIFYQSPWWQHYAKVEDYFARINAVMTQGKEVRDVLVLHPVESAWVLFNRAMYGPSKTADKMAKLENSLLKLSDALLAANIDYDFGDEDIMARHGKVTRGKEPSLKVGKAAYKAVVVPSMITLRSTTLALLEQFAKAGGTVVFTDKAPRFIDAQESESAIEFAENCPKANMNPESLAENLDPVARRVSIQDGEGDEILPTLHLLREDNYGYYLFVCNTGEEFHKLKNVFKDKFVDDRTLEFPQVKIIGFADCNGKPLEMDMESGEVYEASARQAKSGEWRIETSLRRLGSRLFVIPKKKERTDYAKKIEYKEVRSSKIGNANTKWDIHLSENNVLVLDMPRYRIGVGGWRQAVDILLVDKEVRDSIGIAHRGGGMAQPWTQAHPDKLRSIEVNLEYTFEVKAIPSGDLFLGIERPESFRVCVNDEMIGVEEDCGWWCDRSLRLLRIDPNVLHAGTNIITMRCDYDETHSGLEISYLLGHFGVRVQQQEITMTDMPSTLKIGDWVRQGLPFYSGSVAYNKSLRPKLKKGERLFIRVPEYDAPVVRVMANGHEAGVIAWEPNEVDVTDYIADGKLELSIEVMGSRRNSHGPLHHKDKHPEWVGPGQFEPYGDGWWIPKYQLASCGLKSNPEMIVKQ